MTDLELAVLRLELRVGKALGKSVVGKLKPLRDVPDPTIERRTSRRQLTKDDREMAEFRRRLDAAGPNANFETILANLRVECGYDPNPHRRRPA
jgi:hypothetical protein